MAEAGLRFSRVLRLATGLVAVALAFAATAASAFLINIDNTQVVEYYNDFTGHFFLAADYLEEQAVDSGQAGPGWHRTGNSFGAFVPGSVNGVAVYRFYAPGPNSHFYTAEDAELAVLRSADSGWIEEGVKFRADVPVAGACPNGLRPINRLYNDRAAFNDAAHRYVFDDSVRASMVATGWIDEGAVFCSGSVGATPTHYFMMLPTDIRTAADCENESFSRGACIGMSALPASLPNQIASWAPPSYVTRGPDWNDAYGNLTGAHDYDVYTAQPVSDVNAVLAHTYLQPFPPASSGAGSRIIGMHVSPLDASAALASVDPVFQFTTSTPSAGQVDQRVFPWIYANENYLDLFFEMGVQTVKRADAQSHGYGAALIEFRDVSSGAAIDVSMLAYGTVPPGDFTSRDPSTGNVWVSTTFGDSMLFGTNLGSGYIGCAGGGTCSPDVAHTFHFQLSAADFGGIVARARALNPALSADSRDYILVKYLLRNGILGQAEIGVTLSNTWLGLFGY